MTMDSGELPTIVQDKQFWLDSTLSKWFCLAVLVLFVFIYYPVDGSDFDVWFHLKYGEYFVTNLTWNIDHTQFSWTQTDGNWKYVTWIGSSLLFIFYQIASVQGLYILQWMVFLGIFAIFLYYINSLKGSMGIEHFLALILVAMSLNPYLEHIKPEMFSILFFALAVFIYIRAKTAVKDYLFFYPLLFLIWANTHGGFIIGLFFVSFISILEIANSLIIKKNHFQKPVLKKLILSVFLSYLAVLINPYGIYYITQTLHYLLFPDYLKYSANIPAYQNIWQYLFPKGFFVKMTNASWSAVIMITSLLAISGSVYQKKKTYDMPILIANALFFAAAMQNGRMMIFFPVLWLFSFVYLILRFNILLPRKVQILAFVLFLYFALNGIFSTLKIVDDRDWYKRSLVNWIPAQEVNFIMQNKLPGPIFNSYSLGSYMMWTMYPQYKVFIDTRYGPYLSHVFPDFANVTSKEGLDALIKKYPFKIAVITLAEDSIIGLFMQSPDWKLVYFDKVAAVIVRKEIYDQMIKSNITLDFSPNRFNNVKNPTVLLDVFTLYSSFFGAEEMQGILDIYRRNIDKLYFSRDAHISLMEIAIKQKKAYLSHRL